MSLVGAGRFFPLGFETAWPEPLFAWEAWNTNKLDRCKIVLEMKRKKKKTTQHATLAIHRILRVFDKGNTKAFSTSPALFEFWVFSYSRRCAPSLARELYCGLDWRRLGASWCGHGCGIPAVRPLWQMRVTPECYLHTSGTSGCKGHLNVFPKSN